MNWMEKKQAINAGFLEMEKEARVHLTHLTGCNCFFTYLVWLTVISEVAVGI